MNICETKFCQKMNWNLEESVNFLNFRLYHNICQTFAENPKTFAQKKDEKKHIVEEELSVRNLSLRNKKSLYWIEKLDWKYIIYALSLQLNKLIQIKI